MLHFITATDVSGMSHLGKDDITAALLAATQGDAFVFLVAHVWQ